MFLKRLGKGPGKSRKERMKETVNYRNRKFHNVEPTAVNPNNVCSGIEIKQYSIENMKKLLPASFENIGCENVDHITPGGGIQNFTFCRFQK